jgi:hypothetical protein
MTATNNTAQNRFVHYRVNGVPKSVPVLGFSSLVIPDITSVSQVTFNGHDAALIKENAAWARTFTTSFTFH